MLRWRCYRRHIKSNTRRQCVEAMEYRTKKAYTALHSSFMEQLKKQLHEKPMKIF